MGFRSCQHHVTLTLTISFSLHAKFTPHPSFTFHESCHSYITIHNIFLIITIIPKHIQIIQEQQNTQTLAQPFAHAERSRSGEKLSLRRAPFA